MHTRIAGGCLYHASVALGKPINKEQYIKYCSVLQNPEIADNYCAF